MKYKRQLYQAFVSVSMNTLIVGRYSHHGSLTFMYICDCMFKDISIVNSRRREQRARFVVAQCNKNNVSLGQKLGRFPGSPI